MATSVDSRPTRARRTPFALARRLFDLVVDAVQLFSEKRGELLGAGLAFYVLTSLAPLLLVSVALTSLVIEVEDADAAWRRATADILGTRVAELAVEWLRLAREYSTEATAIGVALFAIGASRLYVGLRSSVCAIFGIEVETSDDFWDWLRSLLKRRLMGVLVALGAALAIGAAVATEVFAGRFIASIVPSTFQSIVLQIARVSVSLGVLSMAFALLFRVMPSRKVRLKHALAGGGATAVLLFFANAALDFYFAHVPRADVYSAAGTVVAVLIWLVASSQVVLFGAAVTRIAIRNEEEPKDDACAKDGSRREHDRDSRPSPAVSSARTATGPRDHHAT